MLIAFLSRAGFWSERANFDSNLSDYLHECEIKRMSTSQFREMARGVRAGAWTQTEKTPAIPSRVFSICRRATFYLFPIMAQRQKYNGRLSQFLSKGLFCWRFGADSTTEILQMALCRIEQRWIFSFLIILTMYAFRFKASQTATLVGVHPSLTRPRTVLDVFHTWMFSSLWHLWVISFCPNSKISSYSDLSTSQMTSLHLK